ncbi:putative kinesin [Trypanosoma rangeli]|uniref:Putative kinesin n=1 Tax=Trypanosoma rangeli TaxID=5698 RepID=A0A3R7MPA9_TRYRA|nr:putative kinesin [Trypanosoma rangeli]RNF09094.1 putative kinesin [Trypanosoma rangeli]|eukprot:RNF09094.1 putative kinesin [Trypanosoma rangeli]
MASETSAVFVTVRVRPLNVRESPLECAVTVLDDHTITLIDLSTTTMGVSNSISGQQHVFTFDKIFWSVPPDVLPFCPSAATPPTPSPRVSFIEGMAQTVAFRSASFASTGPLVCTRSNTLVSNLSDTSSATTLRVPFSGLPCFARVPEYDDQESVYGSIGPRLYEAVMTGYNACLFAYGQTGSGKTYSLLGPPEDHSLRSEERGIMPRLCNDLFELMRKEREEDESVTYNVECCFLEIYCERVHDLLFHSTGGGDNGSRRDSVTAGGAGAGHLPSSSSSLQPSLRVRQHPARGPYVEGLSLVKVRDAEGVMKQLLTGLRERATSATRMNEHSSRSHAILQLHITRVTVVREEAAVVTKTRVCKVNMVDLAGSERVAQSGATGDRFEEARNINLSLTTLGRVILQLSEKQSGKRVIPAYRDSVLTWLLSDSLGGNSKTMMLATIAPSSYCYQQTLNTLRFAGVTKKVINVATVNEDSHFQKLIAALRQQIVRLTLQLEEGKAAEVHHEEIQAIRRERDELESQLVSMRTTMLTMVPATELTVLKRRVADLDEANAQLHKEKSEVQRKLISSTTALREELAQQRAEIMSLHEALLRKGGELEEWKRSYREDLVGHGQSQPKLQQQLQQQYVESVSSGDTKAGPEPEHSSAAAWHQGISFNGAESPPPLVVAARSLHRGEALERRVGVLTKEVKAERQRADEAERARKGLQEKFRKLQQELDAAARSLDETQQRLAEKAHLLDVTQSELAAARTMLRVERTSKSTAERESQLVAQLEQARSEYLNEKKTNVDLLMRVSKVEQHDLKLKKDLAAKTQDVHELEQLLLEETETSERYYLRLRYYRDAFGISISHLRRLFAAHKKQVATLRGGLESGGGGCAGEVGRVDMAGLTWEAAACECAHSEAYGRALLEQECLSATLELLGQKTLMYELVTGAANDELLTLRAMSAEDAEEPQRLRCKVAALESIIEKTTEERLQWQATLQTSESTRKCLSRQVEDLTDQVEQLQQSNNALIAKVVEAQSSDELHARGVASSDGDQPPYEEEQQETEEVETQSIQGKQQKRQQILLRQRLEKQLAQYQEEMGLLHAQLEKERNDKAERSRCMQREKEGFAQELKRVRSECNASIKESTQIVKDYEARLNELHEMITTLRAALEEECNNADKARDGMIRADLAKREMMEELRCVTASRDALLIRCDDAERRFNDLHRHVQELQMAYYELERQLSGITPSTADVYLTIDRGDNGAGDGEDSWMLKAQREKEVLERQKRSVQRLNEELLATVRQRNESLRAVFREITKIQRGGVSPDMTELIAANDNSPLSQQLKDQ